MRAGQLVALLLATIATPLPAELRPPVPLRTPALLVPEASIGSGLTPEASVRVSLDARGRVEKIEVLSIVPSSDFDEVFRSAIVDVLSEWRYAPQLRDGAAEPTRLEWRIRFPARAAEARGGAHDEILPMAVGRIDGADAESRRAAILALPEKQRLALLDEELRAALATLDQARTRKASTARFVVHTDAEHADVAQGIANNLEAIFNVLAQELIPGIDRLPERYKIQVVAYRTRSSYVDLMSRTPTFEWSSGYYHPAGLIAFHLEQQTNDDVLSLLLHEATHAFFDRHLVQRGVALPRWLGEGFAEYVGNSEIRKGRLVPGKTVRGKYVIAGGGVARIDTSGGQQLDEAKRALRKGEGLSLRDLLGAEPDTFYGERRSLYYASAWLLVHYLRDGGDGWATERFPKFLLYLAEGYPAEAALRALYGPIDVADGAFRDYVRSF